MSSRAGVALVVALALMAVGARAGSTIVVNSPAALAVNFTIKYPPHGDIPDSPAMFGIPFYGGSQTGVIVESVPDVGCPGPIDTSGFPDPSFGLLTILLINRGGGTNCTFRAKVKACQDAGAVACIITDTQTSPTASLPIMADDGKAGPSLVTPSAIIRKADGDALRNTVRQLKAEDGFVSLTISYALPNPDGHVEWDLWTSANDKDSHQFKHEFLQGVRLLGNSQSFTPHYYIIDGNNHGCVKYQWCGKQCTNGGRYCAVDPEQNLNIGLDGEDVIMEDLRQMCVYQYLNQTGDTLRWWNYVNMFGDQCAGSDATWNYTCSDSILTALNIPPATIAQCETNSGGFGNQTNNILEAEMKLRVQPSVGIFHFPQLVINNELYWGSMACPDPITVATCGPLTALCSAFSDGTKPAACTGDLDCPIAQTRDACGRCMEQNDPTRVTDPNECDQKGGGGVSLGYVVLVSVVGLLVLGAFVFWCIRRQKREVQRDVTNLLRAYVPLDANTAEQMRREKAAPLSHADGSAAPHDGHGKRDVEKRQLITDREDSQIGVGHVTAGAPQSAGGVSGHDAVPPAPADEL